MQTSFLQLITLAAAVTAAPALEKRQQNCNAGQLGQLCCTELLPGISLQCVLQVIGDTCSTNTYCCDMPDNSQEGDSFIDVDVDALNCVAI